MKYFVVIFLSLFLIGCEKEERISIDLTDPLVEEHIILKNEDISVYSDTFLYDLFTYNDISIISENELVDTKTLGENTYEVKYEYEDKTYTYELIYNVIDNEPPRFLGGTNKTITKGYDGDLCNLVFFGDNYDGDLSCVIEGNYDVSKVGTYKLIYKVADSSNNTLDIDVTLNVIEKSDNNNNNTSTNKIYFSDVLNKHKTSTTEVGIDVSKWQGDIDFEKVKNAGATFVMMRIGVQTKQNGELSVDTYFEQNIKNAKDAGLKVGVYLYSIATSSEEAVRHAEWVLDTLNGRELDLPIVFDWENWSKWNTYKMSFYEIHDIANKFMKRVEDAGYKGMLYSSKYYLEEIWTNKNNYPVWLAHYTSKTSYDGDYMMWQLCNTGRIDGIYGDVDINVLYK